MSPLPQQDARARHPPPDNDRKGPAGKARGRAVEYRRLCQCWRSWTDIVELFVHKRWGRYAIQSEDYRALRDDLMASCQALAQVSQGKEQAYYEGLTDLVRPWLDTRALDHADKEIGGDLLAKCQRIDQRLQGGRWLEYARALRKPALVMAAVVALTLFLLGSADWILWPVLRQGKLAWLRLVLAVQTATINQYLIAVGLFVAVALILVFFRPSRT